MEIYLHNVRVLVESKPRPRRACRCPLLDYHRKPFFHPRLVCNSKRIAPIWSVFHGFLVGCVWSASGRRKIKPHFMSSSSELFILCARMSEHIKSSLNCALNIHPAASNLLLSLLIRFIFHRGTGERFHKQAGPARDDYNKMQM